MNIEWLNKNRYRAYPFCEDSDFTIGMVSTDSDLILHNYGAYSIGDFKELPFIDYSGVSTFYTFPKYPIVDLVAVDSSTSANENQDAVYLLGVEKAPTAVVLYLEYRGYFCYPWRYGLHHSINFPDASYAYERTSGYLSPSQEVGGSNSFYTLTKTKHILIPDLDIPEGTYRFKNPPQLIDSRFLRVGFTGVTGVGTAKPDNYGTNTICLGRGCNSELHADDDNRVILYVGTTWGECDCEHDIDDDTKCSSNMMFFNGQTADANGNIGIVGGPGITINPSGELIPVNSGDDSYSVPSITISASSSLLAAIGRDA